jgi:hypothetical protein
MEYEELKALWEKYDNKLDNLEKMNKRLLFESLAPKPRRMLSFLKYKCIQSIIIYPFALLCIIYPNFSIENIDLKLVIGCALSISVLIYLIYINLKTFNVLNAFNLGKDSIIESTRKSNDVKTVYSIRYKNGLYSLPLVYAGIVLIYWHTYNFETTTIILLSSIFIVLFSYNLKGSKFHKNMIDGLEKQIFELNEYIK